MDLLIGKLTDSAINFVNDHKQAHQQLKEWQSILKKIQAVLDDAEEKQVKDKEVKSWLADLQDLAYDVDDVLDEFAYEDLRFKLKKTQSQASTSKVRQIIPACCTASNFSPTTFLFNNKMISNIEEITARLNNLESQMNFLKLREIPGASALRLSKGMKPRLQPTSLLNESIVYVGREQQKKEILELLRSSDGANEGAYVISIVGMGGIGKTTLAQLVFNDSCLLYYYDLKAWVCVSDDFDAINITKNILTSITSGSYEGYDLNNLQVKLKESISGKRFLLVLDDVWNENYNDLFILLSPFGAGTKIIVTTRNKSVSSKMIAKKSFLLERLSHDDCLPIFTQHALGARNFNGHPEFKEVGENIVRRCNGLPLAAKAIGGVLRTILNLDAWKNILESEIWDLPEDQCDILPALQLSYHHLPSPLKRCFAYCSILPKDYEFEEEEIILLWRAEGFLKHNGQLKDIGSQYFHELVSRSFFQISSEDKSRYVMHGLINDLAQLVAREICSKLESDKKQKISARTRHSSYVGGLYDGVKIFEAFDEARNLRTFLPLKLPQHWYCLTSVVLEDLLPGLGHLRALSLSGYSITELPDFFDNLKHLRYLNFSSTEIKYLPDSICTLYHLETLILRGCTRLEKLPLEMGNLSELHHLDIRGASSIKRMPFGMDKLINLQRLSDFVLGAGEGYRIREVKIFSNLRGDFCLSGLNNIIKEEDALEAKLSEKLGIEELKLKWSEDFDDNERNTVVEEKVLNFIYPPKQINKLSIINYGGVNISAWIRDPSLNCLSSLKLIHCKNCKSLPSIGKLPKLKEVFIAGMDGLTKIGVELFGGNQSNTFANFASLDSLHFDDMPNWEEWDCCETDERVSNFPNLCELSIRNCPQLTRRLPKHLPSLRKLVVDRCKKLVVSVSSLPLLCELALDGCEELINIEGSDFKSLKNVSLFDICKYNIADGREQVIQPEEVEVEVEVEKISRIESLTIVKCEKLVHKLSTVLHSFTFLSEIYLSCCSGLVSLSEFNFPPLLKKMVINECENLQCLIDERERVKCSLLPENLTINNCNSLVLLSPRDDVAVRLRHLTVYECSNLSCLFSNNKLPIMLKELFMWGCGKLESIAQEFEETACLESICIWDISESVKVPQGLLKLSHIQEIRLKNCSSEVTLEVEESWLPTHLRHLSIVRCPKFAALPKSINNFPSLSHLAVYNCWADICFPEEGFPTTLSSLSISAAPKLYRSIVEWGFYKLASLQQLRIGGEGCIDVMSFPETGMMHLPPSLTRISIFQFENLECISSEGFRNLTSLEELYISGCPKLTSLPEKAMLLSLGKLIILDCPLLTEEYCNGNKGREWSKIAHIPCVRIDDKIIIPKGFD